MLPEEPAKMALADAEPFGERIHVGVPVEGAGLDER